MAILGENSSNQSLAAAPICQSNKIPMVSVSSTNPAVTKKGDFIFREAKFLATLLPLAHLLCQFDQLRDDLGRFDSSISIFTNGRFQHFGK